MEKPYRYLKKLVKIGNSLYIIMPANWLKTHAAAFKKMKVQEVVMEVFEDKIVITLPK